MKVSLSWLRAYVEIQMDPDQLAHELTMAGLEVDAVYDRYEYLDSVLVGRMTKVEPHPNADKLKLCQVEAGDKRYRVVCGAPNAAVDMLAPLALPGTEFVDGTVLAASTIRGVKSEGMLCSEKELGLGADQSGLMVLDSALVPGTALNQALALSDMVFDIDLTPNRPDCLSLLGVAREIAGIQGNTIQRPAIELPQGEGDINDHTSVVIEAPDHCPRYAARLIIDIEVGPSPFWLQDRLLSVGLRPINNLVDITNFVMMETGQPLHAFDFDQLEEHRIVVRTAIEGEKFATLDEKERVLSAETLMICDGKKPVAIGGVMGGLNSEISSDTTRVLIEGAYFNPVSVRKTAKRLGLNTDAAHRFERGVDPHGTLYAIDRAAQMMVQMGNGKLIAGTADALHELPQPSVIDLKVSDTNRALGTSLSQSDIAKLLNSIEFQTSVIDYGTLRVASPSFRVDVSRPQDLMEEVARRWGYDNIPTTFAAIPANSETAPKRLVQRRRISNLLSGLGFSEAVNYSFIHKDACDRLGLKDDDVRRDVVEILNPLSEDQAVMRSSLIPGLLETMQRNISKQSKTLKLFEIGRIFIGAENDTLPEESDILAGLWTGDRFNPGWFDKPTACDFYDLKGGMESLLEGLHVFDVQFTRLADERSTYTRVGAAADIRINGQSVGIIGEVHPRVLKAYDLKQAAYVFELDLNRLIDCIPDEIHAHPLPKFPSTSRDATLIVDQQMEADAILSVVRQLDQPLVEDVQLFDVFQGKPVPEDRKSVSFRIIYRSDEKTLEDDMINRVHKEITDCLVDKFKADLPA
ncbi:MAG: phenylalanine--tRNA ligase subunit beta [Desulfobacteraceae bacterium]|jgi:phenylalanyl-tRNA synthetase beta chain